MGRMRERNAPHVGFCVDRKLQDGDGSGGGTTSPTQTTNW